MQILPIISIVAIGTVMEFIDSGLGMGYGTVLTPLLMAFGYKSLDVVPAILISQAIGGVTAAYFHHRLHNVDFRPKTMHPRRIASGIKELGLVESFRLGFSTDLKIVFAIFFLGIVAAVTGSVVAVRVPEAIMTGYIGTMVVAIGILLISRKTFEFTWKKLMAIGFLASFNKGFSGGGFGPLSTGGQLVIGNEQRSSIGTTTLAEAPICIIGFITYILQKGFGSEWLTLELCIGAAVGAVFGARLTKRLDQDTGKVVLGVLILLLGIKTLWKLLLG